MAKKITSIKFDAATRNVMSQIIERCGDHSRNALIERLIHAEGARLGLLPQPDSDEVKWEKDSE